MFEKELREFEGYITNTHKYVLNLENMVKFTTEQTNYIVPLYHQIKNDSRLKINVDLTRLFNEKFPNTNYTLVQLRNLYLTRKKIKVSFN